MGTFSSVTSETVVTWAKQQNKQQTANITHIDVTTEMWVHFATHVVASALSGSEVATGHEAKTLENPSQFTLQTHRKM